jgi:hypothetical protein
MRKTVGNEKSEQRANVRDEIRDSGSPDEPLFILKPQGTRRLMGLLAFCIVLLGFALLIYALFPSLGAIVSLVIILGGLLLLPIVLLMFESLLVQEIRLYRDRIVKFWKLIGVSEILLKEARLEGSAHVLGGTKITIGRGTKKNKRPFANIAYIEGMFSKEDMSMFYRLLAELSGRETAEFERDTIRMERLVKETKQ